LAISESHVYANFVSSIDGIAALEGGIAPSGGIISGHNEADRFVMGLLRAFADAVLVGAGTVRAEGGKALWTPDYIFPAAARAFAELRQALKREKTPRLVIVTGSNDLNPSDRALELGALVLTTTASAERLRALLPRASEVRAISDTDPIDVDEIFKALRADGYRTILSEGGPQLFGELVSKDRVDELFLTVSPVLEGLSDQSFGLIRGVDFGRAPKRTRLLSVRRHESHLFLRYQLRGSTNHPPPSGQDRSSNYPPPSGQDRSSNYPPPSGQDRSSNYPPPLAGEGRVGAS
jgi:riboflavin biosynthesis pyrimidine reductase